MADRRLGFGFLRCLSERSAADVCARMLLPMLLMSTLSASALHAGCPRTTLEHTRRIVPSVLFWPLAPFILTSKPRNVSVPEPGTRVRVSTQKVSGLPRFLSGTFVSLDSATVRIARNSADTVTVSIADVECVQVARRTAAAGASHGYLIGGGSGVLLGLLVALGDSKTTSRGDLATFASMAFGSMGMMIGTLFGAGVGGMSWDTVLERPQ